MEKKIDKANENIASLIDELIGARKCTAGIPIISLLDLNLTNIITNCQKNALTEN